MLKLTLTATDGEASFNLYEAHTWWQRLRGLHAVPGLAALWLKPCRSIHTLTLREPVSLLWLDAEQQLLAIDRDVPPRRIRYHRSAFSVIEIPWPGLTRLSDPLLLTYLGE